MRITFFMNHLDKVPICEHGLAHPLPLKIEKWTRHGRNPLRIIHMGDHTFQQIKLGDGWHQITAPNGDRHTARFSHQTLTWARDWVARNSEESA